MVKLKALLFFSLFLFAGKSYAAFDSFIAPASFTTATLTSSGTTISAPGANKKNCLDFVLFFTTACSINSGFVTHIILDGGTTTYSLALSTAITNPIIYPFSGAQTWCGSFNQPTTIRTINSNGGIQINYQGHVETVAP